MDISIKHQTSMEHQAVIDLNHGQSILNLNCILLRLVNVKTVMRGPCLVVLVEWFLQTEEAHVWELRFAIASQWGQHGGRRIDHCA